MICRRIVSCILAMMIITLGCACSAQNQDKSNNSAKSSANKANESTNGSTGIINKQTVTIQYFKDEVDIDKAISFFQYKNPEVTIESKIIPRDNETIDAFSNKLLLDLNTGEGPDIMVHVESDYPYMQAQRRDQGGVAAFGKAHTCRDQ